MSTRLSELCLDADLREVLEVGIDAGWHIALSAATTIEVAIASGIDYERYSLRLVWPEYPEQPPSVACIDPETGVVESQTAWPECAGFRPGSDWDLCLPLSREGFAAHPEWSKDPAMRWCSEGNALLRVLDELQAILNSRRHYQGRMS